MPPTDRPNLTLTRRTCLVWMSSALAACGGGGGGGLASLVPGTGGTGSPLYSQGAIAGFGSVIVNGIKFDDTQATVHLDGVAARSDDLRLGMVAGVQGQRSTADPTLGTAETIEVWSMALGPVQGVDASGFEMLGMTIQINDNTLISPNSAITVGQSVAVWGLQTGTDGKTWKATRVALVAADGLAANQRVVTGLVQRSEEDSTFVNGLRLSGELAEDLPVNAIVRVQGALDPDGRLLVAGSKVLNSGFETYAGGIIEIEGFITSAPANQHFMMGNINVDASNPALSTVLPQLVVGQEVEVYGQWVSGMLIASQIVLEVEGSREIEIEARIELFTSVADFVLRGQRCDASLATFIGGRASDLAAGKKVHVKGTIDGDVLRVRQLELDH